jgi:hypothetical protein
MFSPFLTADQIIFRERNLSSVLCPIRDQTTRSRAQIAISTGLNKPALSSLVEEWIQRGLIKVIPGGSLNAVGNYLLSAIQASVEEHAFSENCQHVEILTSKFGKDARVIGAIAPVANDILSNPTYVEKEVLTITS